MGTTIKPNRLLRGDTIAFISPSEYTHFFPERVALGKRVLEGMGYRVIYAEHMQGRYKNFSARDEERARDVNEMFENPHVKAIIATTGGIGSNRILPLLDYETIQQNPKIIMGISSHTTILNAIHKKTGLVTFHGPIVLYGIHELDSDVYTREYFNRALINSTPIGEIKPYVERKVLKEGRASGDLVGGNLHCLQTLLGTQYEPDWERKILFWEEFVEQTHRIDRILMHYELAGVFEKISGMIVGNLSGCIEKKYTKNESLTNEDVILDHCGKYDFPIMYNLDFGHNCRNMTIPIGVRATIDTSRELFSIDEAAVE